MKTFASKLTSAFLKINITFEKAVMRFISSFALVHFALLTKLDVDYLSKEAVIDKNYIIVLLYVITIFMLMNAALVFCKSDIPERIITFLSVTLLFAGAMFKINNDYVYIFFMILEAVCCYYCFSGLEKDLKIPKILTKTGYILIALVFAGFLGSLLALRYITYCAANYDFGIFAQMFHYMKETGIPYTTCERDTLLSHFAVHMSPIYYLILPFYCIFESPITINVAQAVILTIGFIPLYLLCRRKNLSEGVTLLFALVYAFYPALMGGTFYDIHENVFLVPCVLFLMYFIEADKTVGIFVMEALTLAIKEDAAVYVIFIALFMIFAKKMRLKGSIMLVTAGVYFLFIVWWLNKYGDGAMVTRYENYEINGKGLIEVIKDCITSPIYVFGQCCDADKLMFALKMLVPLGFLPFFCKRNFGNYLLLAPFMIINLMSNYQYQHSIDFQYNFGVLAIFFYLSIVNIGEFKPDKRKVLAFFCVAASVCLFFPTIWYRTNYFKMYSESHEQYADIQQALDDELPDDATIAINTFLLPHVCDHDIVYQLSPTNPNFETRVEYLVFDIRFQEFIDQYNSYTESGDYTLYYSDDNIAILTYDYYDAIG